MEQIRQEIKENRYDKGRLSFEDLEDDNIHGTISKFDYELYNDKVKILNRSWGILSYRYIGNGISGFIKKIFRKLIKFYIEPIVEDQNRYNSSVAKSVNYLKCYIEEKELENKELRNELDLLKKEIEKLKEKFEDYND